METAINRLDERFKWSFDGERYKRDRWYNLNLLFLSKKYISRLYTRNNVTIDLNFGEDLRVTNRRLSNTGFTKDGIDTDINSNNGCFDVKFNLLLLS